MRKGLIADHILLDSKGSSCVQVLKNKTSVACAIGPSVNRFSNFFFLHKPFFCNLIELLMTKTLQNSISPTH
jgi:hypothetical protein